MIVLNIIPYYIILFFIYSFIGWIIEEIDILIETKELTYRGFLVGPICPIYGFSSLIMVLLLSVFKDNIFFLFISSFIICTLVEYLTSLVMEKMFNVRWWDYSHMKFNINGRIALRNSIFFGIMGVLLVYFINPFLLNLLIGFDSRLIFRIAYLLLGLCIMDFIVSFNVLLNLKKMLVLENISVKSKVSNIFRKDNTVEISKAVREKLSSISVFYRKVLKSFPKSKMIKHRKKTNN